MSVYGSLSGSAARALKPDTTSKPTTKHAAARRPLLRLVPSARAGRPLAPYVVLMLGLLLVGLMGLLLLNTWTAQDAFRLHTLQSQQGQLDDDEQALRQQVDDATDPGLLAARAVSLGMVPGDPAPLFVRPNGKLIGASGTVAGAKQGNLLIVQGTVPPPPATVNVTPSADPSATTPSTTPSTTPDTKATAPTGTQTTATKPTTSGATKAGTTKAGAAKPGTTTTSTAPATHTGTAGTTVQHTPARPSQHASPKP